MTRTVVIAWGTISGVNKAALQNCTQEADTSAKMQWHLGSGKDFLDPPWVWFLSKM